MDVSVIMQLKFKQFYEFDIFVPQILFIVRALDISVMPQRQVRTVPNCAGDSEDFTGAVLGGFTVEVFQIQFIDGECFLVANRDEIAQVQFFDRLFFGCGVQNIHKVVDVPVVSCSGSCSCSLLTSGFNLDAPTQSFSCQARHLTMMKVWVITTTFFLEFGAADEETKMEEVSDEFFFLLLGYRGQGVAGSPGVLTPRCPATS